MSHLQKTGVRSSLMMFQGMTLRYMGELKKEQERKATERQRIIAERCGVKKDIDNASDDELKTIVKEYFDKWFNLEGEMFFLQREVILRDLQINELNMSVSDMKGKFIKPTLKKVSKYENK